MPAHDFPKLRAHPAKVGHAGPAAAVRPDVPPLAEVAATSNYTFLHGGSHPEELVRRAAELGYVAVGICDVNSLAGIVRAHVAARQASVQLLVGVRLRLRGMSSHGIDPNDGRASNDPSTDDIGAFERISDHPVPDVALYPATMGAYRHLCRLLTRGKRRAPKGECHLWVEDLRDMHAEMRAVILPRREDFADACPHETMARGSRAIVETLQVPCHLAVGMPRRGDDDRMLDARRRLAESLGIGLIATNEPLYHDASRRMLQDVLTCIRHACTIEQAGLLLHANAERHLKRPEEVHRLLAACPRALEATLELTDSLKGFSLDQLRYEYPDEVVPEGVTPMQHLRRLVEAGARVRYAPNVPTDAPFDAVVPAAVIRQLEHELTLIGDLDYARYFLTVHDLVVFARERGILCQGRGAAANSAVCYCLGVTAVDPARMSVLFERFISKERNEPPDIDIDFEHERREEVIQYIYAKYGRERAALTAEVISYRRRSAIRDVGKALGLSLDVVDRLAKDIEWWDDGGVKETSFRSLGLDPRNPTLGHLAKLVGELLGFPRHLSQHVGGFVITRTPLCELVPIENASMPDRTVIEWDKDDVDAAGMMKVDVLSLGMLTCVRKCLQMVSPPGLDPSKPDMAVLPPEDPAVYEMICRADTVGVFQIESRAQMSMLPRLRPRCFYDLVIEVAIVRPGPIQGDMVHPYLRRRNGEEAVIFPDDRVKHVLGRTLGVPLFQEQCMALAVACAGFTPGEADQLRRAMAAWKRKSDVIYRFGQKIIEGMTAAGYDETFARRVFDQIKGFSEYGFPESHAASFAGIVYASAYLKRHHPAAFAASLINSQPMGFYAPAQIIRDAQNHGVRCLPIDVAHSRWDCLLEPDAGSSGGKAIRLGLRLVSGLGEAAGEALARCIDQHGLPRTLQDLWKRSGVDVPSLRRLADADAFGSMGLTRQQAQWQLRELRDEHLPLFDGVESVESRTDPLPVLPRLAPSLMVVRDYAATGLSLKAHPVSFLRQELMRRGAIRCDQLETVMSGKPAAVAGIVLVRQRPGTAKGITFMTLEDESGIANLIVRPAIYERHRKAARHGVVVLAHGRVERQGQVINVIATRLEDLDGQMAELTTMTRNFH
jgi:error-prone DNA polymerase